MLGGRFGELVDFKSRATW